MMVDHLPDTEPAAEEPDSPGLHEHIDAASLAVDIDFAPLWHDFHPAGLKAMKAQMQQALHLAAMSAGLTRRACELSVALVDDARIHELNRTWRDQDKPTNVLSFPGVNPDDIFAVSGEAAQAPVLLGDIVIARETLEAEAQAQDKRPVDHFLHLLVHGFLHLCGYDHIRDDEAQRMEALETDILADMDIAGPYGSRDTAGRAHHEQD